MQRPPLALLLLLILEFASPKLFAQAPTVGLQTYTPQVFDGYTLLAPSTSDSTYLIDNCGRLVHSWHDIYNPGNAVYLLGNSNLLRLATEGQPANPYFQAGGAADHIRLFDWDSNLLWDWSLSNSQFRLHHDVAYMPNGNILAIAWEGIPFATCIQNGRDPAKLGASVVWSEIILEIEPHFPDSATIVWQWRAWDHLVQDHDSTHANFGTVSQHPELIDVNYLGVEPSNSPDWLHFNNVAYNPALDQVILSSRSLSEVYIIDHTTTTAEAAGHSEGKYGKGGDLLYRYGNPEAYGRGTAADRTMYVQHNPHWIHDSLTHRGQILVFNNGTDRPGGNFSTVEYFNPPQDSVGHYSAANPTYGPLQPSLLYKASNPTDFYSQFISNAQILPNGNTLINEGVFGHLFEINAQDSIIWEYVCPIDDLGRITQGDQPSPGPSGTLNNRLFHAYRYPANYPAFTGRTFTPGNLLELSPTTAPCLRTGHPAPTEPPVPLLIFPNPAAEYFNVQSNYPVTQNLQVMDLTGNIVWEGKLKPGTMKVNTVNWVAGMYFLRVGGGKFVQKLVLR